VVAYTKPMAWAANLACLVQPVCDGDELVAREHCFEHLNAKHRTLPSLVLQALPQIAQPGPNQAISVCKVGRKLREFAVL